MIRIDGSVGEGGGQILRTALSLSLCTGKPFRIEKIRAGRKKPGILRQHLTAVNTAVEVGNADVSGAEMGSSELIFKPGKVRPGNYRFAVGTAGSSTLVFQTIFPALLMAESPSTLICEGGTHNPLAPPYDFLAHAFLPLVERMGPKIAVQLERPGFYPAGGGKFTVTITPVQKLQPLVLEERGAVLSREVKILIADLPKVIAERELEVVRKKLDWPTECFRVETAPKGSGPGNVLMIRLDYQNVTEVITTFGEKGVSSENVAKRAIGLMGRHEESTMVASEYLADQLLIPCALAGGSRFTATTISSHTKTNAEIISLFVEKQFEFKALENNGFRIS